MAENVQFPAVVEAAFAAWLEMVPAELRSDDDPRLLRLAFVGGWTAATARGNEDLRRLGQEIER